MEVSLHRNVIGQKCKQETFVYSARTEHKLQAKSRSFSKEAINQSVSFHPKNVLPIAAQPQSEETPVLLYYHNQPLMR